MLGNAATTTFNRGTSASQAKQSESLVWVETALDYVRMPDPTAC